MPCRAGISAYKPAGPAWLERRTPTQDTPFSLAMTIASSAARDITRWPMPLSPSTRAVAGAVRVTVMSGCLLKPPALRRRIYCGSRKMPWPSAPVRSASVINSAHFAASASGRPEATKASLISDRVARDDTLTRSALLMMRLCRHALLGENLRRMAVQNLFAIARRNIKPLHVPHAVEHAHVVGIIAAEEYAV